MKLNRLFNKKVDIKKSMAKAPKIGSRLQVAKFGFEKVLKKNESYKVIQPQILSEHDDMFFWSCKIISIGKTGSVGIAQKREEGFLIISEKNEKFKLILKVLKGKKIKDE